MDCFSALATVVVSLAFAEALCWGDHLAEAAPPPSFYAAASFVLTPVAFFLGVAAIHARVAAALHPAGRHAAHDNLMYAWAYAYLPTSTASLVAVLSPAFAALFGRAVAKNRLSLSSLNAVVVITAVVAIVALDSGSDRGRPAPPGVTARQYALGFALDVLGSALHGLIFALSELVFARVLGRRSFHVVLEQQAAVSLCAFAFTSAGLAAAEGFPAMRREAARFARGGEAAYANVMVWTAVTFQLGVLGGTGALFLASTVLAGVLNAVRVPLTSVAAVIWFHDPMSGFKTLALVITVWWFASYMVGHSSSVKKTSAS
ncbi:probable purine permease 5 [Panicum virgatum]|uniref:probable purine permease 5 n=1 Tax=Panicum virgatum TaxID=38727 RepID=UPI0019D5B1FB|nr:probable purine permease 5 [Panicum virgatum]